VFDNFFINIIRSGETSGRLEEVLLYLADQLEKDYELKAKIKGAMIYPAFIVSGMIGLGIFMMIFIVPKLTEMLVQSGAELPLATKILKGSSDFLLVYGWILLVIIIAGVFIGRAWLKTDTGEKVFDRFKLKLPIFGNLFKYILIINFCQGLRTLILGGIDLVESLKISSAIMDNRVYKDLILQAVHDVEEGGNISTTFEKTNDVPKIVPQMIKTGEETGKLEMVLEKVGQFYRREVDNLVANMMSLMEPIIMVLLGGAVGLMVAAIIMPMYQVSTNM
jgi:type IV pilus assembly protein PilC